MDIGALKKWFLENKRTLPWRNSPSPYEVLVSEVMLQQTQVSVVMSYYQRWMRAYPTLEALAKADIDEVIKLWEGLGYYSRAKRLHQAAKEIVNSFKGKIPSDSENLLKIKGIGLYTAGAILSFAFKKKYPAVDGNVLRVISRCFCINEPIDKETTKKKIFSIVNDLLPDKNPEVVMEGLIEIGALVCKKKADCIRCPVNKTCLAFLSDQVEAYPVTKKRGETIKLHRNVYLIKKGSEILVRSPAKDGKVMSLLYEFPYSEIEGVSFIDFFNEKKYLKEIPLKISHTFTKYQVFLYPHLFEVFNSKAPIGYEWVSMNKLSSLPFSSGHKKLIEIAFQNLL